MSEFSNKKWSKIKLANPFFVVSQLMRSILIKLTGFFSLTKEDQLAAGIDTSYEKGKE